MLCPLCRMEQSGEIGLNRGGMQGAKTYITTYITCVGVFLWFDLFLVWSLCVCEHLGVWGGSSKCVLWSKGFWSQQTPGGRPYFLLHASGRWYDLLKKKKITSLLPSQFILWRSKNLCVGMVETHEILLVVLLPPIKEFSWSRCFESVAFLLQVRTQK